MTRPLVRDLGFRVEDRGPSPSVNPRWTKPAGAGPDLQLSCSRRACVCPAVTRPVSLIGRAEHPPRNVGALVVAFARASRHEAPEGSSFEGAFGRGGPGRASL